MNKKGILGIALFVIVALFTYAFANPNESLEEETNSGNNQQQQTNIEKTTTDDIVNEGVNEVPTVQPLNAPVVQNVVTPVPVIEQNAPESASVDKSVLSEAVSKANDVLENTKTTNENIISILNVLETERDNGRTILSDTDATQDEVDNQAKVISDLLDDLNTLLDDLYEQVEELVVLQENDNTKENIDNAKEALDLLPDGDKKDELEDRIKDITKPVIILGEYVNTIELGSKEYTMPTYSADDNYDGDITDKVVVNGSIDFNKVGVYTFKYNVTDNALNNADEVSFDVNVVDTTKPVITYPKNNKYYNSSKKLKITELSDYTIYNNDIEVNNYFGNDGVYNVKVIDIYNNASNVVTFTIDTTKPSIESKNDVIIRKGSEYSLPNWEYNDTNFDKAVVTLNDSEIGEISLTDVGTYTYKIVVTDKAKNSSTESMKITVVDDSNLKNIIEQVSDILDNDNSTDLNKSLKSLTDARDNGNTVLNNQDSTQKNLDDAYNNIQKYIDEVMNTEFTVKYVNDDATELASKKVKYGSEIPTIGDPSKEGHTFTGWDLDSNITNVYKNLTIKASYSVNSYNATFNVNNEHYATVSYKYGEKIVAPDYVTPTDYKFIGWNIPEGETMIVDGRTYNATLELDVESLRNKAKTELNNYKNQLRFDDNYINAANNIVFDGEKAIDNSNTINDINTNLETYKAKLDELLREQQNFQNSSKFNITFDTYNTDGECIERGFFRICTKREQISHPKAIITGKNEYIFGFIPTINNVMIYYDNTYILAPSLVDVTNVKEIKVIYTVLKDGIFFGRYEAKYEIINNNGTRTTRMISNDKM